MTILLEYDYSFFYSQPFEVSTAPQKRIAMKVLIKILTTILLIVVGIFLGNYFMVSTQPMAIADSSSPTQEIFVGALVHDYNQTLPLFLRSIENQDFNKALLTLQFNFCSDSDSYERSKAIVSDWIGKNGHQYKKVSMVDNTVEYNNAESIVDQRFLFGQIKESYLKEALNGNYGHCLILSSENFIEPKTLKTLLQKDKPVIAPLLRPVPQAHDPYRNFFPDVTETGYYKDHPDYYPIANREKLGTFKMPCVHGVYLIKANALDKLSFIDNFSTWEFITFSNNARENEVDQYLCNEREFGFVIHALEEGDENRRAFTLAGSELEVTPAVLESIFSPYYANDPDLKNYIENFNFDDYTIFRVQNRDLFYVDGVNDYIKNHVIKRGDSWEEYIHDQFKKYVKPGSVALDIGGHIGTHTLNLSRLVGGSGQVYVFEPQPKMFCELAINMHLNGCQNIKYFHNALGAEEKWIKMHIPPEVWMATYSPTMINEGHGTVTLDSEASGEPAKMIRLDDLHIDNISLIKMDVEGFEMEVIRGGKETILRNKPVMIIEIFKDDNTLHRIKEISSMGYTSRFIGLDNYLFVPTELSTTQDKFLKRIYTIDLPFTQRGFIYNGSMIQYKEGYLLAFRFDIYRQPDQKDLENQTHSYFQQYIALTELDKEFQFVDKKLTLCAELGNRVYDPRLIYVGDNLHLIFSSARPEDVDSLRSSWLCSSKVHLTESGFKCDPPLSLQIESHTRFEKNWVPFDYNHKLYLSYSINPHVILSPSPEGICSIHYKTSPQISTDFGIIRGGTPAVLVDGEYLAFFHSVLNGVYSMAAYTFEASPPFHLTRISPHVFVHPDFYSSPKSNPISNNNVVFPAGIVVEDDRILVSYGENDVAIKVLEIDKKLLFESLQPVAK